MVNFATDRALIGPEMISFPNVFQPNDLSAKYQLDVIFDRGSKTYKTLLKMEKEAIKNRWGSSPPTALKRGIKDGDTRVSKETGEVRDGYAGRLYIKAHSGRAPQVTDIDNKTIDDPMGIKGGDLCVVLVHAFPYSNKFGDGVIFTLHGVRKIKDGEPLGAPPIDAESEMATYTAEENDPF